MTCELKPRYEGATWQDAWQRAWDDVEGRRGVVGDGRGTVGPKITNAEAVALLGEWRRVAAVAGTQWPLYHYLASPAYGYLEPGDEWRVDDDTAALWYPDELTPALWYFTYEVAGDVDGRDKSTGMRRLLPLCSDYVDTSAAVIKATADDGGRCRVPIPGAPPDKWPKCSDIIGKLPPPDKVVPKLPTGGSVLRALVLLAGIILIARDTLDGD